MKADDIAAYREDLGSPAQQLRTGDRADRRPISVIFDCRDSFLGVIIVSEVVIPLGLLLGRRCIAAASFSHVGLGYCAHADVGVALDSRGLVCFIALFFGERGTGRVTTDIGGNSLLGMRWNE